ncbi:hypothetical protein ACFWPV_17330 [Streptomyces uncialis]|uniref:hypothetical protein n=1 Tax=Streptomyces uncialis TaxID=1048205 RepID=UPI00364A2561
MAFDEDWAQLKADAQERQSGRTQLNSAGPKEDLVVRQDDLGAVGNEAFRLHGELRKCTDIAGAGADKAGAGTTARAAAELRRRNLSTGDELYSTLEIWTSQVRTVLQMCAHISNHLDFSKKLHADDDAGIAASLRRRDGSAVPVSEISKYVK